MSIVLDGVKHEVPGVRTISYLDDPVNVPKATHVGRRTVRPKSIVIHTYGETLPTRVVPGSVTPAHPWKMSRYVNANSDGLSWDASVRSDGTVLWHSNGGVDLTYHAGPFNEYAIGIETEVAPGNVLTQASLDAEAKLVDYLTAYFGIQRQMPTVGDRRKLSPVMASPGSFVGVIGHRNIARNRSDPGDFIWPLLAAKGYEQFDFEAGGDKEAWIARQRRLGVPQDGVPGPRTVAALRTAGYEDGLWTKPPGAVPETAKRGGLIAAGIALATGIVYALRRRK